MPSQHDRESYRSWCKVFAFAALLAGLAVILCGCARGWGNGPSSDGVTDAQRDEVQRIRAEREAGQDGDEIRGLMGGGE